MADIAKVPTFVTDESLESSLVGVKQYVDQEITTTAENAKKYADEGFAAVEEKKLDKAFDGPTSKIVTDVTAKVVTNGEGGTDLTIDVTEFHIGDNTKETKNTLAHLVGDKELDPIKADITALQDDLADAKQNIIANKSLITANTTNITALQNDLSATQDTVTSLQGDLSDTNDNVTVLQDKLSLVGDGEKAQAHSESLDAISNLTGTGVVVKNGENTFETSTITDDMIDPDSDLKKALDAFGSEDGGITDESGNTIISGEVGNVDVGNGTQDIVLVPKPDENGKPGVFVTNPTTGDKERIPTVIEVRELITDAATGGSQYRGKYSMFAAADTLDAAKELVKDAPTDSMVAVFDKANSEIQTGVNTAGTWTWTTVEWGNSDWCWAEKIYGVTDVHDGNTGRLIWDSETKRFDGIEDLVGSAEGAIPDEFGLTLNDSGEMSIKMTTDEEKYGNTKVSEALNASNIGYGEGMTIAEKIASMEYRVATKEEIQEIIDKYFPPKE